MNPSQVHPYLSSFVNLESQLHQYGPEEFNLNRIRKFLDLAGNPARDLAVIHVAGTKGKGSTCAFLASILQEAGYQAGLYTSPHLHKVNERIRIINPQDVPGDYCGAISDEALASVLTQLRPLAAAIENEGEKLTYFEVLTVAALAYFASRRAKVVILETGLGGRLDATNAVESLIAIITPVSLDHTRILGQTLKQIAAEKAGIIKNPRQHVVISSQDEQVMGVILERCREFGIQPVIANSQKCENLSIGLKGRHQMINAAAALEAAVLLRDKGFTITEEAISKGLWRVCWPGRFEVLRKNPTVIADCAHNEASAQALARTLSEEYPSRRVILILGVSQDKDIRAIAEALKDKAAQVLLTRANHPRAHFFTAAEAKDYFYNKPFKLTASLPEALGTALQAAGAQEVIVVTGSVFVVAEAMRLLRG